MLRRYFENVLMPHDEEETMEMSRRAQAALATAKTKPQHVVEDKSVQVEEATNVETSVVATEHTTAPSSKKKKKLVRSLYEYCTRGPRKSTRNYQEKLEE